MHGLDPDDPEVREFVAHRRRMREPHAKATVEGMLRGVDDFAQSVNRAEGRRRAFAVAVVVLMLFGVALTVWNAVGFMLGTFLG
nr:hypothetical protein [Saccharopolyspora sp. HNM0983]